MANLSDEIHALLKSKIPLFEEYCRTEQKYSDVPARVRGAEDFVRYKPPRRYRVRHPRPVARQTQ